MSFAGRSAGWRGTTCNTSSDSPGSGTTCISSRTATIIRPATIRSAASPTPARRTDCVGAGRHNAFFSFGENIETGRSAVPDDGLSWRATRQPIVLDQWPVTPGPEDGKFTTVMQWDSYPATEFAGRRYGMKSESFV